LAEDVAARHRELERLYAFGRDLPIEGDPGSAVAKSLDSLVRTFQIEAAAFYDQNTGEITRSGPMGSAISAEVLGHTVSQANVSHDKNTGLSIVTICCGGSQVGSLAVYGNMSALTLRAIADRVEAGLEKVYAHERSRQAEDARKSQELKTALLDSLVHEIKTPLSVIKTAVSSLLSRDSDAAIRRELLTIANQEADRMDASISEAFWRERVEARALQSGKGPHDIRPLVNDILDELRPLLGDRSVSVEIPEPLPPANCDIHMIKGVLRELLSNALKYSPSHSPLTISVQQIGDEIITSVSDSGIGLEPGEEKRIFERYYRGSAHAPGTGLGLAIAKTIVEAHGGRIGVESQPGGGSVFHFSLPVSHRDAA
jgi:two-component system, OmpR family, sensor histidine kinase KdpD